MNMCSTKLSFLYNEYSHLFYKKKQMDVFWVILEIKFITPAADGEVDVIVLYF